MAGPKPDITPLPAYPVRGESRDSFATKANAYVAAQSSIFVPEMNDALDWIEVVLSEFLVFLAAVQSAEGLPALSGNIGKRLTVTGAVASETVEYEGDAVYTAGGTANALTVTAGIAAYAHLQNKIFYVKAVANNTGACTVNFDALGVKNIKLPNSNDPYANAIKTGNVYNFLYDGTNVLLLNPSNESMGLEWKTGLLVSNNSTDAEHDIDVAAGQIMDDTNTYRMNCQAITKRGDAVFSAGTGNGGLASGDVALANNTWYGFFELQVAATANNPATSDMVIATTRARALASTGVTGVFDICRLVGCGLTDGSAEFIAFVAGSDGRNVWKSKVAITPSVSTSGVEQVVNVPPFMTGEFVMAIQANASALGNYLYYGRLFSADENNDAVVLSNCTVAGSTDDMLDDVYWVGNTTVTVNADSEIFHRERAVNLIGTGSSLTGVTIGVTAWCMNYTVTDLV